MSNVDEHLLSMVRAYSDVIQYGATWADMELWEEAEEFDTNPGEIVPAQVWFDNEVLDWRFEITQRGELLGGKLLVAFGGPNIWVDFINREIAGYWGGPKVPAYFTEDAMGVEDHIEEVFDSTLSRDCSNAKYWGRA